MKIRTALLAAPAALLMPLALPGLAHADDSTKSYSVELDELNNTGASGTALLHLEGNRLTVSVEAEGLVPNAPHAQHLHGDATGTKDFHCPTMDDDKDGNGILSVAEGLPDYGGIVVSLTTSGDTSPKSALAVDRMPKADADGKVSYKRTIELSDALMKNIKNLHVVQHGIDANDNGKYDFDAGKSELNPKVPQEATAPATCGMLAGSTMPEGGMETGGGDTSGVEGAGLLGLGGASLLGAAGLAYAARRRRPSGEAS